MAPLPVIGVLSWAQAPRGSAAHLPCQKQTDDGINLLLIAVDEVPETEAPANAMPVSLMTDNLNVQLRDSTIYPSL